MKKFHVMLSETVTYTYEVEIEAVDEFQAQDAAKDLVIDTPDVYKTDGDSEGIEVVNTIEIK